MKMLWLGTFALVLIWSGIDSKDALTWFLKVSPALIGLAVLAITYQRFWQFLLAFYRYGGQHVYGSMCDF